MRRARRRRGLARALGQRFLTWPVAVIADVVLLLFTQLVLGHRTPAEPWLAVAAACVFFAISAGGPLARALRDGATTTLF